MADARNEDWRGAISGAPLGLVDIVAQADDSFGIDEPERYEPGGLIGQGGMGEIRASHDRRLARTVAVKTASAAGDLAAQQLIAEAQLTARLVHPGIIAVHGAGCTSDRQPYYTMPVIRGQSLGQAIETAAPSERTRLVRHFLDACNAVAYAHSEGVVHRDLKPSNILVGMFGETVVVDWGLAAPVDQAGGAPVGTARYMAPEQQCAGAVGTAADVFALGVSLREILTGSPGGSLASAAVPPELAAIVRKATRPEPSSRYRDGAALAADVAAWFEGRQVQAHRYSIRELIARIWAAHRIPMLAAALAIVGIATATAIGVLETTQSHARALASEHQALAAATQAEENFARAQIARALTAAEGRRWADAELLAADALTRIPSAEARGVLARFDPDARPRLLGRHALPRCARLALSPSGAWLACAREGHIRVGPTLANLDDLPPLATRGDPLTILPDGAVVVDSPTEGLIVEGEAGRMVLEPPGARRVQGHAHPEHALSWSRGATERWASLGERSVNDTGVCIDQGSSVPVVTAMRDDGLRVVVCQDGQVFTSSASEFIRALHLPPSFGAPLQIAFAPRGPSVAITVAAGGVVLVDLLHGTLVHRFEGSGTPADLALSERHLALSDGRGAVDVWDLDSRTLVSRLSADQARLRWLDGETLRIVTDDVVEDWTMPTRVRPHVIPGTSGIAALSISRDGQRILTAHGDGALRLSRTDGAGPRASIPLHWSVAKDVEFSPDDTAAVATCAQDSRLHRISTAMPDDVTAQPALPAVRVAWLDSGRTLIAPYTGGVQARRSHGSAPTYVIANAVRLLDMETDSNRGAVTAVDAEGGIHRIVDTAAPLRATLFAIRPGASAVASNAGTIAVLVPAGVEIFRGAGLSRVITLRGAEPTDIAASPDGTTIAVGHHDGLVSVVCARTGATLATLPGHSGRVAALAFDRAGDWLLSGSWDGDVRQWSLRNLRRDPGALAAELQAHWGVFAPVSRML